MVPIGDDSLFYRSYFAIAVGGLWRQEVSLQLVLQQHVVLRSKAEARPEKKGETSIQLLSTGLGHVKYM